MAYLISRPCSDENKKVLETKSTAKMIYEEIIKQKTTNCQPKSITSLEPNTKQNNGLEIFYYIYIYYIYI